MEERAPPSAVTTKRSPSLPANYVSLRQLEEKHQQQRKREEANLMEANEEDRATKRAPRLPPNYVSLRQLHEQKQKRKEEEEARKAKEEEERRRLEMMMREAEEAEKAEAERGKRRAEGGQRDRCQDRRHQQKGEIGDRDANQRRCGDRRKGKSTPPTWVARPAGNGRRRPEVQANAHPGPPMPTAAQKERECEGNEKMDTAEDSQVGIKQGPRKKGTDQFHHRNGRKRKTGAKPGEPALKSTAKEEAAASAGPCAGAVAEIATRLEGALTLAPAVIMKEEEAPSVPAKSDPLPARKGTTRGCLRYPPTNLPASTRQDGPLALATEMGMRPEAVSATPSKRKGPSRGGRRQGFRNRSIEREAYVADEGEADSGMSPANASVASETEASDAGPGEGRLALRGGYRGRARGRSGADGGVLWIRRSPGA